MSALLPARGAPRVLAIATLVTMTGYGVYLTAGVLYFARVVHLSAGEIGIGLTVAGGVALAVGLPVGHLADRRQARGVYAATLTLAALAMAGLCLSSRFWSFLIFVTLGGIAQTAGLAARSPLVQQYGQDRPAEFRGYLQSVTNLGIAVGALLAGWGVQVDTQAAYVCLLAGSALSYVVGACLVLFLPDTEPGPPALGPRWIALRDRPYLVLTLLDGFMAIQYRVLTTAVPLWLVSRTATPHWTVSAVMLVNTGIVVFFQVRVGRSIDTLRTGAIAFQRAGFAFLVSCVAISLITGRAAWLALVLLLAAVVVHTIGEIWHSAGGFELSFGLAAPHAIGQYQGLFGMGLGLGVTIGPAVLIALCIEWGTPGWWVVGGLFALTGLAVPVTVRWAERCRPEVSRPDRRSRSR